MLAVDQKWIFGRRNGTGLSREARVGIPSLQSDFPRPSEKRRTNRYFEVDNDENLRCQLAFASAKRQGTMAVMEPR
jgi:hypothetical protein